MLKYRRLILIKKYLLISLLSSIIPLILSAFLYDRYTASLQSNILLNRLDSDIQAASDTVYQFLKTQTGRLNNLADIPEIEQVFLHSRDNHHQGGNDPEKSHYEFSENLLDFIYLETGNPDIYSVIFLDANNRLIRAIPDNPISFASFDGDQPWKPLPENFEETAMTRPVMPSNGRPGWLGIQRDIYRDGQRIGAIALKLRLASLTRNLTPLYRRDYYEPRLQIANDQYLSVLGLPVERGELFTEPHEIIPGWTVFLSKTQQQLNEPRVMIRYLLLLVVAIACLVLVYVFIHMSERLATFILPLTEGARAIARGDFSVRVSEKPPGELGELSRSFNQMNEQLGKMLDSRVDAERRGAMGNLAAGVAHEIRNPLTTLRTSIHALKNQEQDHEKREIFELIGEEIIRIDSIVEEFLSYAKPHDPSIEDVPISEFLHSIEALVSGTLSEANIRWQVSGDQSLVLRVDPAQLRQVFMNVIINAIDAMSDQGSLSIELQHNNNRGIIRICDTGKGMDVQTLEKIKTPFFTTKVKGSGLGLSICVQLLEKNDGTLDVTSQPGQGTQVTLTLPIKNGEQYA